MHPSPNYSRRAALPQGTNPLLYSYLSRLQIEVFLIVKQQQHQQQQHNQIGSLCLIYHSLLHLFSVADDGDDDHLTGAHSGHLHLQHKHKQLRL
ncbi:hypothetical protein QVD17_09425 [Tagetes erecta]|uniref:Uncharacterized protein n=1 Tax=Tagetes erecta TaxID=13708 RepID=A0AAD8P3Y0_TARER|nr:hypothetical protein QVD17_09425 [Tagetes erecta]